MTSSGRLRTGSHGARAGGGATPTVPPALPERFARAVAQLGALRPRREIELTELPPPQRLAPHAYAVSGVVRGDPRRTSLEEVANGRLILLYDPGAPEPWGGDLRLVTYVTAELEPDLATDPLLPEVGWSWLTDALATHDAGYTALAGTVTQTTSTRFGDLAGPPPAADVEIRASWSPVDRSGGLPDLEAHALAWCGLLASTAGLPPPGVSALPDRRFGGA